MKKFFLLVFLCTTSAFAQGYHYQSVVFNQRGTITGNALITVCTSAGVGQPCTPTASVFTDSALSLAKANPFRADNVGNYDFWAAPGTYVITITGQGITGGETFVASLPCVTGGTCAGAGTNILPLNNSFTGTNAFGALITANGGINLPPIDAALGNVFLVPGTSDAVLYVGYAGASDSNVGTSYGSSFATLYKAIQAAPGAAGCSFSGCGATIHVAPTFAWGGPVSGQGLQIIGPTDPNYASPPSGWLVQKAIKIVCDAGGSWGAGSAATQCVATGNDANHPGVWLAGTNAPFEMDGVKIAQGTIALLTGKNSNGAFSNVTSGSVDLEFNNDWFGGTYDASHTTNGPSVLIGPNSFNITFRNPTFNGNSFATGGTEPRQAMALDAEGFVSGESAFVHIYDAQLNGGGIECNGCQFLTVDQATSEGQTDGKGEVWFTANTPTLFNTNTLSNIYVADSSTSCSVENDTGLNIGLVTSGLSAGLCGINGQQAPGVVLSNTQETYQTTVPSFYTQGQVGFQNRSVFGKTENLQRNGGIAPTRFVNQTAQSLLTAPLGGVFATTGFSDPFGNTKAGQASIASGSGYVQWDRRSRTLAVGDTIIQAGFVRSVTANGYSGDPFSPFNIGGSSGFTFTNPHQACYGDSVMGDGEWSWQYCVWKVLTVGTNPSDTTIIANFDSTHTLQFYQPVVQYIPNGTLSNNEVFAYANALKYSGCTVAGQDCGSDDRVTNFPGGLIVGGSASILVPNDGSTGTTTSTLTIINSSGNAVKAATSSTAVPVFIAVSGAGTTGSVSLATFGQANCVFDGATTVAHFVVASTSTAGDCHDAGATAPTSGWVVGQVMSTNGAGGTYSVTLSEGYNAAAGGSTTLGTITPQPAAAGDVVCANSTPTWTDCKQGIAGRTVSGTTDTIVAGDRGTTVAYTSATAVASSLTSAATLANNFYATVNAQGAGAVTLTPSAGQINGAASLAVTQGQTCYVHSPDNVNYTADCSNGQISWGTGLTATPTAHGVSVTASAGGGATVYSGTCGNAVTSAGTGSVMGLGEPPTSGACTSPVADTLGANITHACTIKNLRASSSSVGVNASDGVVTVFSAPSVSGTFAASPVTCTIGTGQTCSDSTHTLSVSAGNMISVHIVAQTSSTLSSLSVAMDCQ